MDIFKVDFVVQDSQLKNDNFTKNQKMPKIVWSFSKSLVDPAAKFLLQKF